MDQGLFRDVGAYSTIGRPKNMDIDHGLGVHEPMR